MVTTRHAATLQCSVIDVVCISLQRPQPGRQGAAAKVQGKTQQLLSRPMAQIIQDINKENLRRAVQQSKTLEEMLDEEQDPQLQQALQDSAQEAACRGVTALTRLSSVYGAEADTAWYQSEREGSGQHWDPLHQWQAKQGWLGRSMSMCDFAEHLPFHHNLCGRGRDCVLSVREQGEGAGMAVQ